MNITLKDEMKKLLLDNLSLSVTQDEEYDNCLHVEISFDEEVVCYEYVVLRT